jgi:hypothetical protein
MKNAYTVRIATKGTEKDIQDIRHFLNQHTTGGRLQGTTYVTPANFLYFIWVTFTRDLDADSSRICNLMSASNFQFSAHFAARMVIASEIKQIGSSGIGNILINCLLQAGDVSFPGNPMPVSSLPEAASHPKPRFGFKLLYIAMGERPPGKIHAKWDGNPARPPKKGEYYASGARSMAYLARNDLTTPYFIMVPV